MTILLSLTSQLTEVLLVKWKGENVKFLGLTTANMFRISNQSRTNGPINAHLTIAQVMPKYNHNNEKQEALL